MPNSKAHAIVVPYPYQGHIAPTFHLAAKLASTGFTVTYVLPEFIHRTLETRGGGAAVGGVRCIAISDGFSLEFDRDVNFVEYWESMIHDFPGRVDEVVGNIKRNEDSAATEFFLVADSLYTWPADVARKHEIVNVSWWTEPALVFSIAYHLDLLAQNGHFPYKGDGVDHISYIPGVESIGTNNLMSNVQQPDAVPLLAKIMETAFDQVKKADFILCNTLEELESNCLSALNRQQPTYAVGPINFSGHLQSSLRRELDCSHWLESKPPGSVLYISLGSIFEFSPREITEVAHGLLSSRVNFLWVLKSQNKDSSYGEVFPEGFMDRGLVVPWCNQSSVLTSPAIGGFMTHCGWNSILESIWSGVPMICHPLCVDQPTNRKLVVEDWKVGIDLCDGEGVGREEVCRKIDGLMKGDTCIELRKEVKKLSRLMRSALERDGSSHRNFHQFVGDLKGRLLK